MNTRSRNVTQGIATHNCELSYYTSITRMVLICPEQYGMMWRDLGKERYYDRCGRIAYNRRRSSHPPNIRVHCQRNVQTWGDKIQEDWQELEGQTRGSERVHRQGRRQKIKPASCWHMTIINFVAVRLLLTDWNPRRSSPWKFLPISSIQQTFIFWQGLLYLDMGMHRKCVCSWM